MSGVDMVEAVSEYRSIGVLEYEFHVITAHDSLITTHSTSRRPITSRVPQNDIVKGVKL